MAHGFVISSWPFDRPVAVHAEGATLAAVLPMAASLQRSIHVCHLSREDEIVLVRDARQRGEAVTCEVTPHHLFLDEADASQPVVSERCVPGLPRPPIGTPCGGTSTSSTALPLTMLLTPWGRSRPNPRLPASPGLETALPLLLGAVDDGRLTVEDIVTRFHDNPRRIFGLPAQDAEVEVDPDAIWTFDGSAQETRAGWSPFHGRRMRGAGEPGDPAGREVFRDGEVLAVPGSGTRRTSKGDLMTTETTASRHLPFGDRQEGRFYGKDIISVKQFDHADLDYIFEVAREMQQMVARVGTFDLLKGKLLANVFYEPSTRTSSSFTAAMERLGGSVIPINEVRYSSVSKGESLPDTVRTLERYADVIVLRHPEVGASAEAARYASKPIINAGDGIGEHPTQALLDLFTIREELGAVNGLTVTMVGDLKHGRTVHSLARLLSLFDVTLQFVSPKILQMPDEILKELADRGTAYAAFDALRAGGAQQRRALYHPRPERAIRPRVGVRGVEGLVRRNTRHARSRQGADDRDASTTAGHRDQHGRRR